MATVGTTGEGVGELADALEAHAAHQRRTGELTADGPSTGRNACAVALGRRLRSWTTCWPPSGAPLRAEGGRPNRPLVGGRPPAATPGVAAFGRLEERGAARGPRRRAADGFRTDSAAQVTAECVG
ncbi:MAG: hypothetical protein R2704_17480 [Microthrixaceae bacterium]